MINLRNIEKSVKNGGSETFLLRRITLDVKPGEFVSIMGPSGAGKSTLLHILGMHDTDWRGEYDLLEQPIHALKHKERLALQKKHIGFVFQSYHLLDNLTVYENLEVPLSYRDVPRAQRQKGVAAALRQAGLGGMADARIGTLSKGYRQRVALGQALVHEPDVLVLDEPTAGLDPRQVAETRELIARLGRSRSVLLSSHLLSEVANLCRRVVVLDKGRVLAVSDVATLTAATGTRLELRVSGDPERVIRIVTGMPGVDDASVRGDLVVVKGTGADLGQRVAAAVVDAGIGLLEQRVVSSGTLEEAYLNLVRE